MKKLNLCLLLLSITFLASSQCFINSVGSLGQLSKTTNNPIIDQKLTYTWQDLNYVFGVYVDAYVYDDSESPNAFATTPINPGFDGMIAFGINLLTQQLSNWSQGEYAVAGVMAHEWAHVAQLKNGCNLATMQKELHADFLAGYFFGKRQFLADGLNNFATTLYNMGDRNFWDPNHHGTPEQRVQAMKAGYQAARMGMGYAYQNGIRYVTANFPY